MNILSFVVEPDHSDSVLGHALGDEAVLVDHESMLELLNAQLHCGNSFVEGHVLLELVIENRVNKVPSIPLSSLVHLLQSSKIVHPVELCSLLNQVVASHQDVYLVWSFPQSGSEFSSHVLCGSINTELEACSILLELEVSLDEVRELVSLLLLS